MTPSLAAPRRSPRSCSVVIPAKDAADTLGPQLAAVAAQQVGIPWEVVVADNGSTDGTAAVVRRFAADHPHVRLVDASAHSGSAPARNIGVAACDGELVAFCEADDVVQPGWLAALVAAAPHGHLLGGAVDSGPLNDDVARAWRVGVPSHPELPRPMGFWPIAVGANCAVWRDVLHDAGGWNERYRTQTDVELSWRLQRLGYHLEAVPEAVVHYSLRTSLGSLARQARNEGRGYAQLYADFRDVGAPRKRRRTVARHLAWSVWHLPDLRRGDLHRGVWIRRTNLLRGRLEGSLEFGVLYP